MDRELQFQLAYKQNGHIKKIRKKTFTQLIDQVAKEISSYLKYFSTHYSSIQQLSPNHKFQSHLKKKAEQPILNINIRPLLNHQKEQPQKQFYSQSQKSVLLQDEESFNQKLQLLKDQIELFKSQQDIKTLIETEKNIASNIEDSLTFLLESSLKICWNLLKQDKSQSFIYKDPSQMLEKCKAQWNGSQTMMIKENLQEIEDKCLQTLNRIKEERRRLQLCGICLNSKSNTILLPCMHLGTCSSCSKMITKCPFCKLPIYDRKNVYQ